METFLDPETGETMVQLSGGALPLAEYQAMRTAATTPPKPEPLTAREKYERRCERRAALNEKQSRRRTARLRKKRGPRVGIERDPNAKPVWDAKRGVPRDCDKYLPVIDLGILPRAPMSPKLATALALLGSIPQSRKTL